MTATPTLPANPLRGGPGDAPRPGSPFPDRDTPRANGARVRLRGGAAPYPGAMDATPAPGTRPAPPPRLVVLGLGPAGTALAHRAAARGWPVLGVDPAGPRAPSTVGAWADQLPGWLPAAAVAARVRPVLIDAAGRERALDSEYAVLDVGALAGLGGFAVARARADARCGPAGPEVTAPGAAAGAGWDRPDAVADTRPARPLAARQLAYGQVLPAAALPAAHRRAVLMDFRVPAGAPAGADALPATFSYRIPLGGGRWLVEETILAVAADAAGDAALHAHLRRMQAARLADLGVAPGAALAEEVVDFPLGPRRMPPRRRRGGGLVRFGAAAGWMHPATGYSVGWALADADRVLDVLAAGRAAAAPGGAAATWLRRRGLRVLLGFDAPATRAFFAEFARLPEPRIRAYLTGASPAGIAATMVALAPGLARRAPRVLGRLLATVALPLRPAAGPARAGG